MNGSQILIPNAWNTNPTFAVPPPPPPQAQVVLQGKSRGVIIRELQRTNLDVNLAVNNLLSRDDEDGDDGDDTASESYLPGGERPLGGGGGAAPARWLCSTPAGCCGNSSWDVQGRVELLMGIAKCPSGKI